MIIVGMLVGGIEVTLKSMVIMTISGAKNLSGILKSVNYTQ